MKTITFYSYKGGVGRSLALSNMAMRLSQLKKKVCVIDFDLNAPGLRFKFPNYTLNSGIQKGLVNYIYEFSNHGKIPENVKDYIKVFYPSDVNSTPIHFLPAGDIINDEYWKMLSMIKWYELFYNEGAQGIRFFLDLKAKIEKEINPDVLLIDSRTGITDISGITLRLFADEIIVLAVNNKENIFGSKKIIKNLYNSINTSSLKVPKIRFVMTRIPFSEKPEEKAEEFTLLQDTKADFQKVLNIKNFDISVIHSDKRLEKKERHLIGNYYVEGINSIANDYLNLFDLVTEGVLTEEEKQTFKNIKLAEEIFTKFLTEKDNTKKLDYVDKAIELNNKEPKFYLERAVLKLELNKTVDAGKDLLEAIKLNPKDDFTKFYLGYYYYVTKDEKNAASYFDQVLHRFENAAIYRAQIQSNANNNKEAIDFIDDLLKIYPDSGLLLNTKANTLRRQGKFDLAMETIYRAIELDPNNPIILGSLAEIYADKNELTKFYLHIGMALANGLNETNMNTEAELYKRFKDDEKFLELISKYQLDINEIIREN